MTPPRLPVTGDPEADRLLEDDPFALLLGMQLDQQQAMEWAFAGPLRVQQRMGVLDARVVAEAGEERMEAVFRERPPIHRYPASMAKRAWQLAKAVVDGYDGDAGAIWRDVPDGSELLRRMKALPGFGEQKAQIFVAILGKRFGVQPDGWREAAGRYGDDEPRSVADIDSPDAVAAVRASKQAAKAAAKAASA